MAADYIARLHVLLDHERGILRPDEDAALRELLAERETLRGALAEVQAELEQWRAELARNDSGAVWLAERNEELRDALIIAAELLKRLSAPGPCSLDGDGACQGHDGFANGYLEPCPHPLGRRFVEAWRTVQGDATERPDREGAEKGPESNGDGRTAHGAPLALSKPEEALRGARGADGLCGSRVHRDFADGQDIRCQLPAGHAAHRNGTQEWTP